MSITSQVVKLASIKGLVQCAENILFSRFAMFAQKTFALSLILLSDNQAILNRGNVIFILVVSQRNVSQPDRKKNGAS